MNMAHSARPHKVPVSNFTIDSIVKLLLVPVVDVDGRVPLATVTERIVDGLENGTATLVALIGALGVDRVLEAACMAEASAAA
jgi:hypothetical protein